MLRALVNCYTLDLLHAVRLRITARMARWYKTTLLTSVPYIEPSLALLSTLI
jgi:hypothetical protein